MSTAADPYQLQRFLEAQERDYPVALAELMRGQKQSHWMWYIFPQVAGLGTSPMAQRYAIQSREEAAAYLADEVLGSRIQACAAALLSHKDKAIREIMGFPDDLKLRSSMTLFASLSPGGSVFHQALEAFFEGQPDERTIQFLKQA